MQSVTTTLPTVTTAQDGPNSADTSTDVYDINGNLIWSKDGDGYINYYAYDLATGALIKSIVDVNTSDTSDFDSSSLPTGWSTISGAGLELITSYVVDLQGRTTKMTDPNGNITYIVYDDIDHWTKTYTGWNASTDLPTGPVEMTREDWAHGYTETLTYTWTGSGGLPVDGSGVPTGAEDITTSNAHIQSLSRDYTNDAGQVVRSDRYFNLSGVTYSTTILSVRSIQITTPQPMNTTLAAGSTARSRRPAPSAGWCMMGREGSAACGLGRATPPPAGTGRRRTIRAPTWWRYRATFTIMLASGMAISPKLFHMLIQQRPTTASASCIMTSATA